MNVCSRSCGLLFCCGRRGNFVSTTYYNRKEKTKLYHNNDIMKVGHHGSDFSSDERFLDKIQPEISVISCGEHNRYGHPGKETLKRLKKIESRIFRTDQQGAVILKFYRNGEVKCTCPTDKGQVY